MNLLSIKQRLQGGNITARWAFFIAALFAGFMLSSAICHAAVFSFDWPTTPAWSGTGPTSGNTETVDYGYYANGSVRVAVFNNGETWQAGYPIVQTGASRTTTGGTGGGVNGFQLYNNNVSNVVTNYERVTITFMYTGGANAISFQLWDVDFAASVFKDTIRNIVGIDASTGATVQATTITPSSANQVVGTVGTAGVYAEGTAGNNNTSANGNVTIGFSQTVRSISFDWSNSVAGGTTQAIGIGPIGFNSVGTAFPEVNSSGVALMLCGGVMGFGRFRRRRNAESSQCLSHA